MEEKKAKAAERKAQKAAAPSQPAADAPLSPKPEHSAGQKKAAGKAAKSAGKKRPAPDADPGRLPCPPAALRLCGLLHVLGPWVAA
jgi:hypothetical protein